MNLSSPQPPPPPRPLPPLIGFRRNLRLKRMQWAKRWEAAWHRWSEKARATWRRLLRRYQTPLMHVTAIVLLGMLILAAYANSLQSGMVLDSDLIIRQDPRLRQSSWTNVGLILAKDYQYPNATGGLYRPLTTLSYLANYSILGNGERPAGYHWVNLAIHLGNAMLVYLVLLRLLQWYWPAVAAAALFAMHPLGTEAVTNIVGRADLLATLCVLLALWCYMGAVRHHGTRRWIWLGGTGLAAMTGVFCKESAIAMFGVLPALDVLYRIRSHYPERLRNIAWNIRDFLVAYTVLIPAALGMFIVRDLLFNGRLLFWNSVTERLPLPLQPWTDNPLRSADFLVAKLTAIKVLGMGMWRMLVPINLSCDYSFNQIPLVGASATAWENSKAIVALVVVLLLLAGVVFFYKRSRALSFLILVFFVMVALTSNVPVLIGSIMAERHYYMPLAAYAGMLVIAIDALCRWGVPKLRKIRLAGPSLQPHHLAGVIFVLLVVIFGVRTHERNKDWLNNAALWESAVRSSPNSYRAHNSLALALYTQDPAAGKNIDRSIEESRQAVTLLEGLPPAHRDPLPYMHLGMFYGVKADQVAERDFNKQIVVTATSKPLYLKSVEMLEVAAAVDQAAAKRLYQAELDRGNTPADVCEGGMPQIYQNLAVSRQRLGRLAEAIDARRYERHLNPEGLDAYAGLLELYRQTGQLDNAAIACMEILAISPNQPSIYLVLRDLYQQMNTKGAVMVDNSKNRIWLDLESLKVRVHIGQAYYEMVKIMLASRRYERALHYRNQAIGNKVLPRPLDEMIRQSVPPEILARLTQSAPRPPVPPQ